MVQRLKRFLFVTCLFLLASQISFAAAMTEAQFETARKNVKRSFVGLDPIVDQVMDQMKSWALYPETRIRPLVIFLAGPTSTGKTALVTTIVRELQLQSGLLYFDMDRYSPSSPNGQATFGSDLENALGNSYVKMREAYQIPENPVFLLDEFQKVNTMANGGPVERPAISKVWEFLGNDGKLSMVNPFFQRAFREIQNLDNMAQFYQNKLERGAATEEEKKEVVWHNEKREALEKELGSIPRQVTVDLSGSLVFIAANLDHVFAGSRVFDPEILTADQLHELTASVKPGDVRNGLGDLFRAEHVGRFGTRIIPMPTLPETAFRHLIEMRLQDIAKLARARFQIELRFSDAFKDRIYKEGVTPSQGPRPLQTSVATFAMDPLGSVFSKTKVHPEYTAENPAILQIDLAGKGETAKWSFASGPLSRQSLEFPIPTEYLRSRKLSPEPKRSLTAVRLAGTVTAYAKLKEALPRLVRANSRSSDRHGYVDFPVALSVWDSLTRSELIDTIAVRLAPHIAEEIVFGEATLASTEDLSHVSGQLASMVNYAGLGSSLISISMATPRLTQNHEADLEEILAAAKKRAREALLSEPKFFSALAETLREKPELTRRMIQTLVAKNWLNAEQAKRIQANPAPRSKCTELLSQFVSNGGTPHEAIPTTPVKPKLGL